jgi:hypothetical protein
MKLRELSFLQVPKEKGESLAGLASRAGRGQWEMLGLKDLQE